MAEETEDIIIIEDTEAAASDEYLLEDEEVLEDEETSKKKKIIIFGLLASILVVIIFVVIYLVLKPKKVKNIVNIDYIEQQLDKNQTKHVEVSKLEKMIAKANYLYSNGSKNKALVLYEQIAQYSEAISMYNLGVAQLKDGSYELALKTFQKAIQNDEKRCVSAINAAVCSLHLKDKKSFHYYIDLAYAYLPNENNSPLYSYYYALINYYKNNYFEALSALYNPTSDEYPEVQKHLKAKIDALFCNNYRAIESMEKNFDKLDSFSIALLYARVGDLSLALKYLQEAKTKNIQPLRVSLVKAFIHLKLGSVKSASKEIKNATEKFEDKVYEPYPIKVKLKDSLFDSLKAQLRYREKILSSKTITYQKIFYFAPYKVFNPDKTISYIQKGNANIYIDNISSAKNYLKRSASSSSVNQGIVKAIKKALSFKLREANKELQRLVKIQPKHSILHYDLALTYAQMGDMIKAHKHFLRSFHLNSKNYLSGIFAVMSAELINKENSKLESIIKESLLEEEDSEELELYKTLLYVADNNYFGTSDWLERDYKQRPLYLALDTIIALQIKNESIAKTASHKLTILLPNEILPHMMYIDAHFSKLKSKEYAKQVMNYLKVQKLSMDDLYFGPYITRYLYIQQNLITGKLYFLREDLKQKLSTMDKDTQDVTSALALASLYDGAFEESYTLYNTLIDDLRVRDAYTLFLGAVASTAASHHANAIALLELSKMKDTNFLESRYALGLLYLEIQNNRGAVIQLSKVGDDGFSSDFFNFDIDLDKLMLKKNKKKIEL
jgi:Flp pilus assembly protein TadD